MRLLGKIFVKLMPKKLVDKAAGRALKKAPKVNCGLFSQASNTKRQQAMAELLKEANLGSTEVSLSDLLKSNGMLHQNAQIGQNISKNLLG